MPLLTEPGFRGYLGREIEEGILLDKVHSSFAALFLLILSVSVYLS